MTSPAPVLAPDIGTYDARTPYLTPTEFIEAGTGCDVSQLVPGAPAADQTAALARTIRQASAWADSLTYKVLAATVDTRAGLFLPDRYGSLRVPLPFTPVIAVTGVSIGWTGASAAPLASLASVWLDRSVVHIDAPAPLLGPPPGVARGSRRWVQVTYVNGWTNTTLAAGAAVGATSISLASTVGVHAGQTLTIDDGATTELVTVAPSWIFGSAGPVPLTASLGSAHNPGAAATALPPDIKRAVIALTACLIKTRGSEALVMASIGGEPSRSALSEAGGIEDFELATDLLERHRRVR